jgi:nucleolar protein 14
MTPEERMLERFTRERQRNSKVSFNLEDADDGGGEGLTHYGQSISALDDFDATGITLEDDEEMTVGKGQIDGETVGKGHFGGFGEDEDEEEGDEDVSP